MTRSCIEVQARKTVDIVRRHSRSTLLLPVLLLVNASQHSQRSAQLAFPSKLDVGIKPVANHARPLPIQLEFALDGVHHGLRRLAQRQRLLLAHVDQRDRDGARAGEEGMRHWQRAVGVGCQEDGAAAEVLVAERQLQVVDVEVEAGEDDADLRVQQRAVGDAGKVLRADVAAEGRVGAADEVDALGAELGLDAGLADDEDLALALGELEDAGDVDGGGVGGAEDVLDLGGDVEGGELLVVVRAGLCGVVGYEDGSLACFWTKRTFTMLGARGSVYKRGGWVRLKRLRRGVRVRRMVSNLLSAERRGSRGCRRTGGLRTIGRLRSG